MVWRESSLCPGPIVLYRRIGISLRNPTADDSLEGRSSSFSSFWRSGTGRLDDDCGIWYCVYMVRPS